jgi:hypothetical protein
MVSPVGRTGTTPVAVAVSVVVVTVDEVAIQDEDAQAYPFPQHPPPISTGQGWEFVEHARVVWRPVYILVDTVVDIRGVDVTGVMTVTTVCVEEDWEAVWV